MIGWLKGHDRERSRFLSQAVEQAFRGELGRQAKNNLRNIVHAVTGFQDSVAMEFYRTLLVRLAKPTPEKDEWISTSEHVLKNLLAYYPDRISEFEPLVEALPFKAKQTPVYRTFRERLKAAKTK